MDKFNLSEHTIKIIKANKVLSAPTWSWNSDNNGWRGFHFWHVFTGSADVRVSGEYYTLVPGDSFIFHLDETHLCSHHPENPLGVYAVYFHMYDGENNFTSPDVQMIPRHKKFKCREMAEELLTRCVNYWNHQMEDVQMWFRPVLAEYLNIEASDRTKDPNLKRLDPIFALLENEPEKNYTLKTLSKLSGYSPNHLIRLFKKSKNMTPHEYWINQKIEQAKRLLLFSNYSVNEISEMLNYIDVSHFSMQFKSITGMNPSVYRRHNWV